MSSGMENAQNFAAVVSSMVLGPSFFFDYFLSFSNVFHFLFFVIFSNFRGWGGGMFSQNMVLGGVFLYLGMGVGGYVGPFWGWGVGLGVWGGWGGSPTPRPY